jgi:hypothetical protein
MKQFYGTYIHFPKLSPMVREIRLLQQKLHELFDNKTDV